MLTDYPNLSDATLLLDGFKQGFKLNYTGPRYSKEFDNLLSVKENPEEAIKKLQSEIDLGRMAGPFNEKPISNLRCSPIGLVPKKTGGLRLITHLSYPPNSSVNDYIDEIYTKVKYSSFDNATHMVQKLGKNALLGKKDIKSAFRLLKVYPGDFDLLGIKLLGKYYIDKTMPMGCSKSSADFEKFSTFLHWAVSKRANSDNLDHYLDDFLFAGEAGTDNCKHLMLTFDEICKELGVPIANEKTEGPTTIIEYLGLIIDSQNMMIKIPLDKITKLLELIDFFSSQKKVTLKHMQSLTGCLAFCTKALPSGRAFSRRLYSSLSQAKKPHHFIRVSNGMKKDLLVWKSFLTLFNGHTYIQDFDWVNSPDLELYTDSAGGKQLGCGAFLNGSWACLKWPSNWAKDILSDITYLEIIPIALAIFLWGEKFTNKKILFHCDNSAVVSILNSKTSKSERVMSIVRTIVLWTLKYNFQFKAIHLSSVTNIIADSLSRGQLEKFKKAAPAAEVEPTPVPQEFWDLLI